MITVVIPTMWRTSELKDIIRVCTAADSIVKIQIINNDQSAGKLFDWTLLNHPKIQIYTPPKNIYITAAWNYGVQHSQTDIVCLLNDDIVLDSKVFDFINNSWPTAAGIIGLGFKTTGCCVLNAVNQRTHGFGQCMFLKRTDYQPIPEDLKLWFNDDWLFKYISGQHYQIMCPYQGRESATTSDPAFNDIKQQDTINWKKYE